MGKHKKRVETLDRSHHRSINIPCELSCRGVPVDSRGRDSGRLIGRRIGRIKFQNGTKTVGRAVHTDRIGLHQTLDMEWKDNLI